MERRNRTEAVDRYRACIIGGMTSPEPPRLRLRLHLGRSVMVGPGKADLLAAVAAAGSITAAGRAMNMSYKRAWLLVDTMNRCFREPLVTAAKGGAGGGNARLTPAGERVLALYRRIEAHAAQACADDMRELADLAVDEPPEG